MRLFLILVTCAATLFAIPPPTYAGDEDVQLERDTRKPKRDTTVEAKLEAKGTPYVVDDDGDYRIEVNLGDERSQVVWVRSVIYETRSMRVRELWTYGMRSNTDRMSEKVANLLLARNPELIVGSWSRINGSALYILRIDADASADILDNAIDIAAWEGDDMERKLVKGDDL